jgi:folylpolyglutamate synthase/dihydropteroate synthase
MLPTDLLDLVEHLDAEGTSPRRKNQTVTISDNPISAWQACRKEIDAESLVCVTGSFFLAAEIRDALKTQFPESSDVPG